jgi:hypothetical protein
MSADSPLTSTSFSEAYKNEKIVILAMGTNGILTNELMDYLITADNPVSIKMAVINRLGWEGDKRQNSLMLLNYLRKKKGYKDKSDFEKSGADFELLSMAYLRAMENYFEVDDAIVLAEKALLKNKTSSYTFRIITAMIKAQKQVGALNGWCEVYYLTNRVREDKTANIDLNEEAISIIFEYMDGYKEFCGKK